MAGSIDRRSLRFHRAMLGLCAGLFGYMIGLLTRAIQAGSDYSVLQWILVGSLLVGSATLLTYQIGQVRRRGGGRPRGSRRSRRLEASAADGSDDAGQ